MNFPYQTGPPLSLHRFPGHSPTVYFMNVSFDYRGKKMDFAELVCHENPSLTRIEIEALTASRNYPATTLEEVRNSLSKMLTLIRQYGSKLLD